MVAHICSPGIPTVIHEVETRGLPGSSQAGSLEYESRRNKETCLTKVDGEAPTPERSLTFTCGLWLCAALYILILSV